MFLIVLDNYYVPSLTAEQLSTDQKFFCYESFAIA